VLWGCYDATVLDIAVDPQRCCRTETLPICVCLLLQDLVQSCLRGGGYGRTVGLVYCVLITAVLPGVYFYFFFC
jgi:hypothetical protein